MGVVTRRRDRNREFFFFFEFAVIINLGRTYFRLAAARRGNVTPIRATTKRT